MHAYYDDPRVAYKGVKVFVDGKEVDKVIEVMTGKRGFVTCYEFPYRVIGDCAMRFQMRGSVTLEIPESS